MPPDSVVQPVSATRPPPPAPPEPQLVEVVPPFALMVAEPVVVMVVASIQTEPPEPEPPKVVLSPPFALMAASIVTDAEVNLMSPPPAAPFVYVPPDPRSDGPSTEPYVAPIVGTGLVTLLRPPLPP